MLELRFIRENIELVKVKTAKRGMDTAMLDRFMEVDKRRLAILGEVESLNEIANECGAQPLDPSQLPRFQPAAT